VSQTKNPDPLFRTQGSTKDWLLVKKPDAHSDAALAPESILSGLSLEEVQDGSKRAQEIRGELERLGAPRSAVVPQKVGLMLAETGEKAFSDPAWLFELKYDGYRLIAARSEGRGLLLYRRGQDSTAIFPEVARGLGSLPFGDLVLDGEVVVLDEEGRPSFQRLQKRALLTRPSDVARASVTLPATYYAFDLLGFEGFDLRGLPLKARKELLRRVIPRSGPLRFSDHVEGEGEALYGEVQRRGLEGIMAKRGDAPYRAGRSTQWLKLRVDRTDDFVVVGFSEPQGSRSGFGALHVAASDGEGLVYAGRVGSGFTDAELGRVRALLESTRRETPAFRGPAPTGKDQVWVEPRLVCEVRYKEWTGEGHLRHPVFLRFRDDKAVEE
jgi:bifunctional non-homologous end joining protein LigD